MNIDWRNSNTTFTVTNTLLESSRHQGVNDVTSVKLY